MADFLITVCSESYVLVTKNEHLHDCLVVMVVVAGLITGNVQPNPTYIIYIGQVHILLIKPPPCFVAGPKYEMFQDSDLCLHSSCNIPLFCFIVRRF